MKSNCDYCDETHPTQREKLICETRFYVIAETIKFYKESNDEEGWTYVSACRILDKKIHDRLEYLVTRLTPIAG